MTLPRMPGRIARTLRVPGYLILSGIVAQWIFDLVASISPLLPRLVAWRVRALGLTANSLTTPLLALLLLYVLALACEHRAVLRVLSVVAALGAIALVAGSGILALDAAQLSRGVPAAQKSQYALSAVFALGKLAFGVLALLVLTRAGFKSARVLAKEAAAEAAKPLLVRTPGAEHHTAAGEEPSAIEPRLG